MVAVAVVVLMLEHILVVLVEVVKVGLAERQVQEQPTQVVAVEDALVAALLVVQAVLA
jgi:hypothetical protein